MDVMDKFSAGATHYPDAEFVAHDGIATITSSILCVPSYTGPGGFGGQI